jgi:hypothetical protein
MVSGSVIDYDPEDDGYDDYYDEIDTDDSTELTPHQEDFTQVDIEQDPQKKAQSLLDDLLNLSCAAPLEEVHDMALNSGLEATDILKLAEESETCFVDWISGHIRCKDA